MSSLAERLAQSARQSEQQTATATLAKQRNYGQDASGAIPAKLEAVLDVQGEIPITEIQLGATPLLKILKHSTDPAVITSSTNPSQVDAVGLLLGLDISGTAEIVDSYPLPGGIQGAVHALGSGSDDKTTYAQTLLNNLREVALLDSPIGIYLTLHSSSLFSTLISEAFNPSSVISNSQKDQGSQNAAGLAPGSGFLLKGVVDLMAAVEKMGGSRGSNGKGGARAVLIVHDAARSASGDVALKAYKFSDAFASALRAQKFDTASLIEHRLSHSNILSSLPVKTQNPALLNALFTQLSTPSSSSSTLTTTTTSTSSSIPTTYLPLQSTTSTSLPLSLSHTLSQITNLTSEQNNLAFQLRQVTREKSRHEQAVQARMEENQTRQKQGLAALPDVAEPLAKRVQDPSRLDLLLCLGAVDNAAKTLAGEAGKGLVTAFASG